MPDDLFAEPAKESAPRLLAVEVENVKRISLAKIDASGNVTRICGDTGQGKTAILDAVRGALDGIAPGLVRHGADKASVTIRMDRATIHRVINADGTGDKVRVLDGEGVPLAKAKDFLRALSGDEWNALDWVLAAGGPEKGRTERERTQRNQLLAAIPCAPDKKEIAAAVFAIGPDAVEAVKAIQGAATWTGHALDVCAELGKAVKATRTEAGRAAKDAEAELKAMPEVVEPDAAAESATLSDAHQSASAALVEARAKAYRREGDARRRDALAAKIKAAPESPDPIAYAMERQGFDQNIATLESRIEALKSQLADLEKTLAETRAESEKHRALGETVAALARDREELAALESIIGPDPAEELARLESAAALAKDALDKRGAAMIRDAAKAKADALAARVATLDKVTELFRDTLPAKIMARMEMPVEGLAVGAESVTLRGVPLHQLGTSEAIRLGVAIWRKRNPGASFLGIDRGESLGKQGLRALAEIAEAEGIQLLVTVVDADAEPGNGVVVMKDGEART